ncbi:MAG: histidine kinase [Rhodothermales bacterium]|nr:histidine kinase [Rhodothermales bacterium]
MNVPSSVALNESLRPWPASLNLPVYVLLWSIPGIAALSFYYLTQTVTAGSFNWTYALVSTFPNWYIWAVLAPVVVKVSTTWTMDSSNWLRVLLTVHVPVLFAAMMVHSAFNLVLFRTAGLHDVMNLDLYRVHFTTRVHANIFTYATIVGAWYAFDYYRKFASRERQAASLQIQLAQANLRALKMQIHPHFLFNTLNSIAALVRKEENRPAVRMLGQLGEFLRIALENKGQQEIPLEQEFDFLRKYLDIERVRFGDRLQVNFDVDPGLRSLYVPNLILQPIVENAIHHGISPQTSGGRIDIVAREEDGRICMSISDNGPGLKNPDRLEKGVGVANTQARLENLYGKDQEFSLRNAASGGLEVRVCIPKCPAPVIRLPENES